jgi:hypothetical protein
MLTYHKSTIPTVIRFDDASIRPSIGTGSLESNSVSGRMRQSNRLKKVGSNEPVSTGPKQNTDTGMDEGRFQWQFCRMPLILPFRFLSTNRSRRLPDN